MSVQNIFNEIINLSITEIYELYSMLNEKFSLSNSQKTINDGEEQKTIQKRTCNVKIKHIGNNRLAAIKILKDMKNISIKEAKDMIDQSDKKAIFENIQDSEAEEIMEKFKSVGSILIKE
ncbi:ribosomal protein L7/L12 [Candidatus Vidania fulgoroideorum]